MRKIISVACAGFCLTVTAIEVYAFEIGGSTESITNLFGDVDDLLVFGNQERIELFSSFNTGTFGAVAIGGSAEIYLPNFGWAFDLDYLTFRGDWRIGRRNRLDIQLGRFLFDDPTRQLLLHKLDGAKIGLQFPHVSIEASGGYTGLLFNNNAYDIVNTRLDVADLDDSSNLFAPSRLIGMIDIRLVELIEQQDIYFSTLLNLDLRPDNELTDSGRFDGDIDDIEIVSGRLTTVNFTLGITGSLAILFYNLYGTLQSGETLSSIEDDALQFQYQMVLSWMTGLRVGMLLPGSSSSLIEGEFFLSSGDGDWSNFIEGNTSGDSTQFVPVSLQSLSFVFRPTAGNIGYASLRYSFLPFGGSARRGVERLQLFSTAILFFRPTDGPISVEGVGEDGERLLLFEGDLGINWRPASDIGIGLLGGVGIPFYSGDDTAIQFATELRVSISF